MVISQESKAFHPSTSERAGPPQTRVGTGRAEEPANGRNGEGLEQRILLSAGNLVRFSGKGVALSDSTSAPMPGRQKGHHPKRGTAPTRRPPVTRGLRQRG